jgi:hypothetical protein
MVNYNLGKIYKIIDNTTNNIYIGSTCEPILTRRLTKHVGNYREYLKGKHNYITSFKIFENADYNIILIENYPCNSKDELIARERYYIENTVCVNKSIPGRTKREYRCDNAEKINEYSKQYYKDNKEKICRKFECYCGSIVRVYHKSDHFKTKKHQTWKKNLIEFALKQTTT